MSEVSLYPAQRVPGGGGGTDPNWPLKSIDFQKEDLQETDTGQGQIDGRESDSGSSLEFSDTQSL